MTCSFFFLSSITNDMFFSLQAIQKNKKFKFLIQSIIITQSLCYALDLTVQKDKEQSIRQKSDQFSWLTCIINHVKAKKIVNCINTCEHIRCWNKYTDTNEHATLYWLFKFQFHFHLADRIWYHCWEFIIFFKWIRIF